MVVRTKKLDLFPKAAMLVAGIAAAEAPVIWNSSKKEADPNQFPLAQPTLRPPLSQLLFADVVCSTSAATVAMARSSLTDS